MGNLSNGHCEFIFERSLTNRDRAPETDALHVADTAFVKSSKGAGDKNWLYCDDSKVTQHTVNDVVVSVFISNYATNQVCY